MVQLRGASTHRYQPLQVSLAFSVQPLMLGKAIVDAFGLTNVDLDPCSYHILTSMGGSKKTRRLTEQQL
jgi:hypothetical protein